MRFIAITSAVCFAGAVSEFRNGILDIRNISQRFLDNNKRQEPQTYKKNDEWKFICSHYLNGLVLISEKGLASLKGLTSGLLSKGLMAGRFSAGLPVF